MTLPHQALQILVFITLTFGFSRAEIKYCYVESSENKCTILAKATNIIKCVPAPNIFRCMEMVSAGTADVLLVSDTELYPAGKLGLKPLLQLIHNNSADYRYKAVAVVKAGGKIKTLDDLKDAKSCHTGAGKTTGWTTPISNLIGKEIMPTKDCYSSTQNVADFFAESCVPGAMTERYNPFNRNPHRLCALCHNKTALCSPADKYANYDGAMACLDETTADIAFVKHETVQNADKKKYKLLCPNGTLMEIDAFHDCNWAVRPTDTIVVSPKVSDTSKMANDLIGIFAHLKAIFGWESAESLKKTSEDYSTLMGEGFKATFEHYHNCKTPLRWCVIDDGELKKCTDLKHAFMAKRATNYLECFQAKNHHDCMTKIEQKKADFVVLDGGDVSTAINNCKLEPVIAENYGDGSATYYTVAVVKKDAKFNIKQLKGKKSCHTGIGKTSGWKSPISYLIQNNMLPTASSIPEEVGKFFNASCVPGALNSEYNPHNNPKSLCALCPNNGSNCQRNAKNKYYGYTGALRCLVETDADVAFVKHTTVKESTDGNGKEKWEENLKSSEFKLLCKDETLASVSEWSKCHFAKVPSHAIVVRTGSKIGERLFRIFNNFDLSSKESLGLLFSSHGGKDYLFKDSTTGLIYIDKPNTFLGKGYLEILKVFGTKLDVCSSSSTTTTSIILLVFSLVNYFAHF